MLLFLILLLLPQGLFGKEGSVRAWKQARTLPPWVFVAAVAAAAVLNGIVLWRNPGDLDRLLINMLLAMSAFVTLHARLLSLG